MAKMIEPASPKKEEDYEADNAVDTLIRAHEIKSNKDLMSRVKKKAGRKLKALSGLKSDINSIQDIRDTYNEKYGSKKKKHMMHEMEDEDMD